VNGVAAVSGGLLASTVIALQDSIRQYWIHSRPVGHLAGTYSWEGPTSYWASVGLTIHTWCSRDAGLTGFLTQPALEP
jgi:hypothetical protein